MRKRLSNFLQYKAMKSFILSEAGAGVILLLTLCFSLFIANSPFTYLYDYFQELPIQVRIGAFDMNKPLLLWVNEGFMAIFFMLLAMEIKREFLTGKLASRSQVLLPFAGAIGGIILPAFIFLFINKNHPAHINGWPIPTTTDIAFMLGMVAIFGKDRIPPQLKAILIALSIVDDILAIIIIAAQYTDELSWISLGMASIGLLGLVLLNIFNVKRIAAYMLMGLLIWLFVLKSGVHATLGGVVVGMAIPLRAKDAPSLLKSLEASLRPWVMYFIIPLFVFVNGGIPLREFALDKLFLPVSTGISLGLCIGKTLGVFLGCALVIKAGMTTLPRGVSWRQLLGVSALTGIGFTMSLFLTALAFTGTPSEDLARQGVLLGSFLSCVIAAFILKKPGIKPSQE